MRRFLLNDFSQITEKILSWSKTFTIDFITQARILDHYLKIQKNIYHYAIYGFNISLFN